MMQTGYPQNKQTQTNINRHLSYTLYYGYKYVTNRHFLWPGGISAVRHTKYYSKFPEIEFNSAWRC